MDRGGRRRASERASHRRRTYELPALGERLSWQRDALIVSLLAYSGLRPGELRALRWGDVHAATILVQRAANPDGSSKSTSAPWGKSAWQMWRADRWVPACGAAGLSPIPRPYDLRHSFASLLLAEGRQPLYVAWQLGHSVAVLLETYAHLIDEYAERERIDAEAEIADARRQQQVCHQSAFSGRHSEPRTTLANKKTLP